MRVFGSIMNRLHENCPSEAPQVGMGATILMYSDRHAATIVEVLSPKRVIIQQDTATRTDKNGQSESQEYTFAPNPQARRQEVSLRKNGKWILSGEALKNGTVILIGERDEYCDFSF